MSAQARKATTSRQNFSLHNIAGSKAISKTKSSREDGDVGPGSKSHCP